VHADKSVGSSGAHVRARVFSFVALSGLVAGIGWLGTQAYRAATDSFVAPIILSPDNDVVLANKVKLSELMVERARGLAELDGIEADLRATDQIIARLESLRARSEDALAWTTAVTKQVAASGAAERRRVHDQRALLDRMGNDQKRIVTGARADVDAGLVPRTEYEKEVQALGHIELALSDNEHARIQTELTLQQVALTQRSLATTGGAPTMPEAIVREEQMARIELELVRIEAERRAKRTEKKVIQEKLARIDELEGQLRARPIFRATERSLDIAFVPYTQLEGVVNGAAVYDCVWGLVHCQSVGSVAELVPGEVVLPDPWGNQARGQYVVLDLAAHDAAKSKSLRVRMKGTSPAQRIGSLWKRSSGG
jgi:hypothetical protein